LQKIGEGGMGVVFEAVQETPVHRRVALKLIKWGMDTRRVVARFEAERQALALMNHPNVARVLDAGATPEGRPFFVMEYVRGVPITEHCDRQRLTTGERLELFTQVCEGVQHAHQKGIIHRDIKPSNILVEFSGGKGLPKIIDFGVAKATEHRLTEKTLFTEIGQLVGTPEYMSPEQAEMTHQDIDTRTDVYSLGVVLYELMVGALPFDPRALREAGYDELRRRIREEEPPKPSTRISTLEKERQATCASRRRTDPRALVRSLRGDLDWIMIRALEKDRSRRYASATELARDVRRHLEHQPVEAGPPTIPYKTRKFVMRHRAGVAAAIVASLAVLTGSVLALGGMFAARQQRDIAVLEAAKAEAISDFLMETLADPDPFLGAGRNVTMLEAIEHASAEIEPRLGDQPEVEAAVKHRIGETYHRLGQYQAAEKLLASALEIRLELFDRRHADVAESIFWLASARHDLSRFEAAEAGYLEALETWRALYGDEHPRVALALNTLARLRQGQGDFEQAEVLFRQALAMRRRLLGAAHPDVAETLHDLAQLLQRRERYDESKELYEKSLEINLGLFGRKHPQVAFNLNGLAAIEYEQGNSDEAERLFRESLEIEREVLGPDHEEVGNVLLWIAHLKQSTGDLADAAGLMLEANEIYRRELGEDHERVANVYHNLAVVRREMGQLEIAVSLFRQAEAIREEKLGPDHWLTAVTRGSMGACLIRMDRYEQAEPLLTESFGILRESLGPDHSSTRWTAERLVELYERWGRPDDAGRYEEFLARTGPSSG
jgi:tetratricopeptide (TPR) repeat protein